MVPTLALAGAQWVSWASCVPFIGPVFSVCKLGARVTGEEVSQDSFQNSVEGENPNSAKIAKVQEERSHPGPPPWGRKGLKQRQSPLDLGGAAPRGRIRECGTRNGHSRPTVKVLL